VTSPSNQASQTAFAHAARPWLDAPSNPSASSTRGRGDPPGARRSTRPRQEHDDQDDRHRHAQPDPHPRCPPFDRWPGTVSGRWGGQRREEPRRHHRCLAHVVVRQARQASRPAARAHAESSRIAQAVARLADPGDLRPPERALGGRHPDGQGRTTLGQQAGDAVGRSRSQFRSVSVGPGNTARKLG
jgi:hypothetical protein